MEVMTIVFPDGNRARTVYTPIGVTGATIVEALELPRPEAVLLLNGGASEMSSAEMDQLHDLLWAIARLIARESITVIDGGTRTGVMQMIGEGYAAAGGKSPLIGVCPAALVSWPGGPTDDHLTPLEPHHTHFVLTPGHHWGAETETMFALAATLSANAPSLAILVNGGSIALQEILSNVRQKRETIVLRGSGRLADIIAATVRGDIDPPDDEIATIVRDGHITVFDIARGSDALVTLIRERLFQQPIAQALRTNENKMSTFNKFEEYKLFIEDTARLSERRQTVTNTYITVNSALLGLITFLVKDAGLTDWWLVAAIMPLIAAGIIVCSFWYRLLATYRQLLNFRFEQLEKMEQSEALRGCHEMYNLEAQRFFRNAPPNRRIGFSRIEVRLPLLFIALYALTGIGLAVATWMVGQGLLPPPVIQP